MDTSDEINEFYEILELCLKDILNLIKPSINSQLGGVIDADNKISSDYETMEDRFRDSLTISGDHLKLDGDLWNTV